MEINNRHLILSLIIALVFSAQQLKVNYALLKVDKVNEKKAYLIEAEPLSAGFLARVSGGFSRKTAGQDQPPRSNFYALAVVCEEDVQSAKDSLGAPDGRSAEILPGGQLVLLMENKLYPFPTPGAPESGTGGLSVSGLIIGEGGEDFRLDGLFAWQDTQGKKHFAWIPLGVSGASFSIFPHLADSFEPKAGMDMIKISNVGTESLFVDAVIGNKMGLLPN